MTVQDLAAKSNPIARAHGGAANGPAANSVTRKVSASSAWTGEAIANPAASENGKPFNTSRTVSNCRTVKPNLVRTTASRPVARTGFGLTVRHFEAVRDVLKNLPFSDAAGLAMASPVQAELADTLRVTLFAAGPFAAPPWARAMGFDWAARS